MTHIIIVYHFLPFLARNSNRRNLGCPGSCITMAPSAHTPCQKHKEHRDWFGIWLYKSRIYQRLPSVRHMCRLELQVIRMMPGTESLLNRRHVIIMMARSATRSYCFMPDDTPSTASIKCRSFRYAYCHTGIYFW